MLEQLRAGAEHGGVDDQQVLVDQPGRGDQGREGRRASGQQDVLAVPCLQGGEGPGDVALDHDPVVAGFQRP